MLLFQLMDSHSTNPSDNHFGTYIDSVVDDAFGKYPSLWYEKLWIMISVGVLVGVSIIGLQFLLGWNGGMPFVVIGFTLHILGYTLDIHSTILLFQQKRFFEIHKIEFPFYESNVLLPDTPSSYQLILSFPTIIFFLFFVIIYLIPAVSFISFVSELYEAAHNHRNVKRVLYIRHQLQI